MMFTRLTRGCLEPSSVFVVLLCFLTPLAFGGTAFAQTASPKRQTAEKGEKKIIRVQIRFNGRNEAESRKLIERIMEQLKDKLSQEELGKIRSQLQQAFQRSKKALQEAREKLKVIPIPQPGKGRFGFGGPMFFGPRFRARLGVGVFPPSPILAEHLKLEKGIGMVVNEVIKGSVAEKAGIRRNDVLVEIGGKKVPSDYGRFVKLIRELPAGKALDAVVIRKGARMKIKGITFPKNEPRPFPGPAVPETITLTRRGEGFSARYQRGPIVITITGKVKEGKAMVQRITTFGGGPPRSYEKIEDVPKEYRAIVNRVMRQVIASTEMKRKK